MLNKISDITAIILCGGKSERMGVDKGLLKINGKTFIENLLSMASQVFDKILLSANDSAAYSFLSVQIVRDLLKNAGPLGGIHAGLQKSTTEKNFIITCDMPFIRPELIFYLSDYLTSSKILLPQADGRVQFLCGIYSKNILPELEDHLVNEHLPETAGKKSGLSVKNLLAKLDVETINIEKESFYNKDLFFNMNSPEDYEYVKKNY